MVLVLLSTLVAASAYGIFNWHNKLTIPFYEEGPQQSKMLSILGKMSNNYSYMDIEEVRDIFYEYYHFFAEPKSKLGIRRDEWGEYITLDDVKLAFQGMRLHMVSS